MHAKARRFKFKMINNQHIIEPDWYRGHKLLLLRLCLILSIFIFQSSMSFSQESQTAYNFLRLPVLAHVAALGGENITLTDDDATLIFPNPALINGVSDKTITNADTTYQIKAVLNECKVDGSVKVTNLDLPRFNLLVKDSEGLPCSP